MPVQGVDATPPNRLIRQRFPLENRLHWLLSSLQVGVDLVLHRPIEFTRGTGQVDFVFQMPGLLRCLTYAGVSSHHFVRFIWMDKIDA